jgi:hypothetical protein
MYPYTPLFGRKPASAEIPAALIQFPFCSAPSTAILSEFVFDI